MRGSGSCRPPAVGDRTPNFALMAAVFECLCRELDVARVLDGFQLPPKRENVFGDPSPKK